ncbi:MAG: hypothetical protein HY908_02375 [Myxococcales bacterium]|nr:hypothetical protein [Myxococcales bacterium]
MDIEKRDMIAQWAFDTRPVLLRFHLWLDDVEVERAQAGPVSALSFTPRAIARCLAITSAATALGTRLFGKFGEGHGQDKQAYNQVKKAADAISAYALSEGLWHLTRSLPENHAIMVCLGEGLMPKGGETPEMGANPLLGFGRVYARPEVARFVDGAIRDLINDPKPEFSSFYRRLRERGVTVWGAAVDTLECTSRFAEGKATGPMSVIHLFDSPLTITRPYEAYFGCLTVPRAVARKADELSVVLDWVTPRKTLVELIEATYPGIRREHIHVWTLRGRTRAPRIGKLWDEWKALGAHLIEDDWKTPTGIEAFTDSGTYAPTVLVRSWQEAGATHVMVCDGYAGTAEAVQAASLSQVFDVDSSMAVLSDDFRLPYKEEYRAMRLAPDAPDFEAKLRALFGDRPFDAEAVTTYRDAIHEAELSNVPLGPRVLRAADFMPEKHWRVLSSVSYMGDDPYTGAHGVEQIGPNTYRVTTMLATQDASSRITFTLRFKESLEEARLIFSPLLVRYMSGVDWTQRPVKISDSGRIRNELQTLISQALEYEGHSIRVRFDKIDDKVLPREKQDIVRRALTWYKATHPVWFNWLELA